MTIKHGYPGTFADQYDDAQADAMAAGVCPKVIASTSSEFRACGGERVEGSLYCWRHKLGAGSF